MAGGPVGARWDTGADGAEGQRATRLTTPRVGFSFRQRSRFILSSDAGSARSTLGVSSEPAGPAGIYGESILPRRPACRHHASVSGAGGTSAAVTPTQPAPGVCLRLFLLVLLPLPVAQPVPARPHCKTIPSMSSCFALVTTTYPVRWAPLPAVVSAGP